MKCLILLLACLNPVEDIAVDHCDVLFTEHFYDDRGRLVFTQLVPLDWNQNAERWDVVSWRLVKCRSMIPERDWRRGGYVVRFMDGETLRIIRADGFREEWNQRDSELAWREVLRKEDRRLLTGETPSSGWGTIERKP